MKKFIAIFAAAAMLTAALTACSSNDNEQENGDNSSSSTSSTPAEEQPDDDSFGGFGGDGNEDDNTPDDGNEGSDSDNEGGDSSDDNAGDSATQKIVTAIKDAYDPDTIPYIDMLPEELIGDMYGLDADTYTEVTAHVAMISTYVDTVVVVKAAEGKTGDVEAALNAYHDRLVNESLQYPINVEKVNAAQVVTNGDYVAFIMLGAIDEREDASDSDRAEFAQQQTKIGVDAFNAYFG